MDSSIIFMACYSFQLYLSLQSRTCYLSMNGCSWFSGVIPARALLQQAPPTANDSGTASEIDKVDGEVDYTEFLSSFKCPMPTWGSEQPSPGKDGDADPGAKLGKADSSAQLLHQACPSECMSLISCRCCVPQQSASSMVVLKL